MNKSIEDHLNTLITLRLEDLRSIWSDLEDEDRLEIIKSIIWTAPDNHDFYNQVIDEVTSEQFKETLD